MKTEKIEMTPYEIEMIAQAIAVQCADNTDFTDNDLYLKGYQIELEEVTYGIDCNVVVHYPNPRHLSDCPPFERSATAYDLLFLDVTKCYPDYSIEMETDKYASAIERMMCNYTI